MPCSGARGQCPLGELAPLRTEWSVGDLNWPASGSASQINRIKKNILVAKQLHRSNDGDSVWIRREDFTHRSKPALPTELLDVN